MLEAITTLRCCETFSMERLELLGDSVLKYAISYDLFLRYPTKHEGQLSARRVQAVCNSALHKLGINCKLQVFASVSDFHDLVALMKLHYSHMKFAKFILFI